MSITSTIKNLFNKISLSLKELEENSDDVLELSQGYRLYRYTPKDSKERRVLILNKDNKTVYNKKDTLPETPAKAAYEALKKLEKMNLITKKATKDIWTCGFRSAEQRWVWYKNSAPKMVVAYNEAFKEDNLENKFQFHSINYGVDVISSIRVNGIEKTAKKINAMILEHSYTKISCNKCNHTDNYTIDDLIDKNKIAKYDSNFIACTNCDNLVKLI